MSTLDRTTTPNLADRLTIGIIQNTVNKSAWEHGPTMSQAEALGTRAAVQRAVSWLTGERPAPQIIVLPELSVSRDMIPYLEEVCRESGSVVIAGVDYTLDHENKTVRNEAIVLVPNSWPDLRPARSASRLTIGKTYAAPGEEVLLTDGGWRFAHDPNLWIFDSGPYGRFGICICYDLMDVERPVLYRGQVHHLFVLAYNRDISSFAHIAEAICRTVYCNVVVVNTGYYGGSVALTPYYESFRRPTYRMEGQKLVGVQAVQLPVASLDAAWKGNHSLKKGDPDRLKELPPRFRTDIRLAVRNEDITPSPAATKAAGTLSTPSPSRDRNPQLPSPQADETQQVPTDSRTDRTTNEAGKQ